ncbi:MAG: bifunctional precorrin-2 dehydrogenase/sirohydrochlorin ferrochelatase [Armatimonadetes bacterium]|nr:bifunctional precorrin-2 dehydrogenase/sirohydrochlorin ferrochelatase [Armatimonadota bacterium]
MARHYPIGLNVEGRSAVVVGGGRVARRKVETLLECGAAVRVVAPTLEPGLRALLQQGRITVRQGPYAPADLEGAFLVIAATNAPEVNARVAADARARGVLVNSADPPEVSDFIVGAGVRRGDLVISILTGGSSPALSRHLRERLETAIGPEYGELASLLGRLRAEVLAGHASEQARAMVWQRILQSEVLDLLRAGRAADAERRAREIAVEVME